MRMSIDTLAIEPHFTRVRSLILCVRIALSAAEELGRDRASEAYAVIHFLTTDLEDAVNTLEDKLLAYTARKPAND
jgi:hypothetical protein